MLHTYVKTGDKAINKIIDAGVHPNLDCELDIQGNTHIGGRQTTRLKQHFKTAIIYIIM